MNRHRLTAYFLLLIVSVIWGLASPVIKFTLHDFPPIIFLTYRFAISSLAALIAFSLHRPRLPKAEGERIGITVYGFLTSTVALGLLFLGLEKTTSISGNLLSAVSPLMIAAAGAMFLREHVTKPERLGIGIAFIGTLVAIVAPSFTGGTDASLGSMQGNLLILASLLVGVLLAVQSKYLLRDHVAPSTLTHIAFLVGFFTMLPVLLLTYSSSEIWRVLTHAPLSAHLGVWYMGLLSGTLAYSLWHKGQKMIEISEVALFSYLLPVWGTPFSVLWLGEKITPLFILGSTVIAAGVFIAEYRKRTRPAHRPARRSPLHKRKKR